MRFAVEAQWTREVVDDKGTEHALSSCHRVMELERPAERADRTRRFGLELGGWLGVRRGSILDRRDEGSSCSESTQVCPIGPCCADLSRTFAR